METEQMLQNRLVHIDAAMDRLVEIQREINRLDRHEENPISQQDMSKLRTGRSGANIALSDLSDERRKRQEELVEVRERLEELEGQDDES